MESIKELRAMLQTNVLGHPYLQRALSIYITRPLLATSITPNQVTVVMLVAGVSGAIAIFFDWVITGFILLYVSVLLDAVDGEIARYKKVYSLRGVYLDNINHLLVPGLFFLAFAFYVGDIFGTPNTLIIIAGALGALAQPLLIANGDMHRQLFVRPYSQRPDLFPLLDVGAAGGKSTIPQKANTLRLTVRFFIRIAYKLRLFAIMLIVIFFAYLCEMFLLPEATEHPVLSWVILGYTTLLWAYLIREIVGSFLSIERKVASVKKQSMSTLSSTEVIQDDE